MKSIDNPVPTRLMTACIIACGVRFRNLGIAFFYTGEDPKRRHAFSGPFLSREEKADENRNVLRKWGVGGQCGDGVNGHDYQMKGG